MVTDQKIQTVVGQKYCFATIIKYICRLCIFTTLYKSMWEILNVSFSTIIDTEVSGKKEFWRNIFTTLCNINGGVTIMTMCTKH